MLRLADHLPNDGGVDAIYVPGLCLTYDTKRLTALNRDCMIRAVEKMQEGLATYLIFSGCYSGEVLERELMLRRELASGINTDRIREIKGIVDTKDELEKLSLVPSELNAKSVLFVSDEYHIPRLVRWARLLLPNVEVFHIAIRQSVYEFTWEPSLIKVIRAGMKPLWIVWNLLFYAATPFLLRQDK